MDLCEAHRWLAKAAANGSEPAKEKLAKMALNGAA
jgi:TPR repeat protein